VRKSFILHIDSLGILNELTDEQAGQLFKLIYNYYNPNKPIETQITQLVNLAFYSFKSQFERDLQAYNKVCDRNKNNGMLGGRPKKNNPNKPKKPDNDNKNKNNNDNNNDNKNNKNLPALKNKYLDSITLSDIEYNKLLSEYAQHEVDWMIDCLNNYKMSSGVRYKSDYHAICKWVKDAFRKAKVDFIKDNNTSEVRVATAMKAIENINWDDYTNQL
jgi:hypothetical protein